MKEQITYTTRQLDTLLSFEYLTSSAFRLFLYCFLLTKLKNTVGIQILDKSSIQIMGSVRWSIGPLFRPQFVRYSDAW